MFYILHRIYTWRCNWFSFRFNCYGEIITKTHGRLLQPTRLNIMIFNTRKKLISSLFILSSFVKLIN